MENNDLLDGITNGELYHLWDLLDKITNDNLFLIWLERCHLTEHKADILEAISGIVSASKAKDTEPKWNQLRLFE